MLNEGAENMVMVLLALVLLIAIVIAIYNYYNLGKSKISVGGNSSQNLDVEKRVEKQVTERTEKATFAEEEIDEKIYLHIAGEVKEPGVYKCSSDARLYNLVEQAGGITKKADLNSVNLVKPLQDGARVTIPSIEESNKEFDFKADREAGTTFKININQATKKELIGIKGIGEVTADKILAYRKEKSGFDSLEELMEVSGIGQQTYQQLKDEVTY